jgi:cell division protein FtsW
VSFLALAGLVMVYSASSVSDYVRHGTTVYHLLYQGAFLIAGSVIAYLVSRLDFRVWKGLAFWAWAVTLVLIAVTALAGVVRGGAKRWISLGIVNVQPSELAKVATILLVALIVSEWRAGRLTENQFVGRAAIAVLIPAAGVIAQRDLGSTVSLVLAAAVVLYVGGMRLRWFGAAIAAMVPLVPFVVHGVSYRMARIQAFLDPWADPQGSGYQTVQALLAFGTGGLDGVGLGLSRQKFFYLPEAHTDFILAIVGEEIGLIGTLAIVAAFAVFCYAGIRIAMGAKDTFGRLLAAGITGMIGFQALINMAAVTGLTPVTGKPLPFMSYGGSSMLVTMGCVGMLLSVSASGARAAKRSNRPRSAGEEGERAHPDERRGNRRTHLSGIDGGRAVRRRA